MQSIYLGFMSGTSIDSIDVVAIALNKNVSSLRLLGSYSQEWSAYTRQSLHKLCSPSAGELTTAGKVRHLAAAEVADAINALLKKLGLKPSDITAIGSHGQTIRHCPHEGFTWQLDDPSRLASLTGIDVIADFRSADVARGGEGAPLTPLFHREILGSCSEMRYVLNIGGICNLTVINTDKSVVAGYDTGPGNTLMDLVCRQKLNVSYDKNGLHAKAGTVDSALLEKLLSHPYLALPAPKSTGRETFNEETIHEALIKAQSSEDIDALIATLAAFTVEATVREIVRLHASLDRKDVTHRLILCGGGAFNPVLREGFRKTLAPLDMEVSLSSEFGVSEQYLEAEAFAYFASLFCRRQRVNLSSITGSTGEQIMGALYPAVNGAFACKKI